MVDEHVKKKIMKKDILEAQQGKKTKNKISGTT